MSNPLEGVSVLVVENEFLLAINLETIMRDAGAARVELAASIADAKVHIEKTRFDASILDIRLMDGDSLPLAEDLIRRGVPVVIHSGHANLGHSQAVPEAVFLPKPSTPTQIVQSVLESQGVFGSFELKTEAY